MVKEFEMGQKVFAILRKPDGRADYISQFVFVVQAGHAAILRHDLEFESYSPENLLTRLLLDTACEESPDLWVVPTEDCYADFEVARRRLDFYWLTEDHCDVQ